MIPPVHRTPALSRAQVPEGGAATSIAAISVDVFGRYDADGSGLLSLDRESGRASTRRMDEWRYGDGSKQMPDRWRKYHLAGEETRLDISPLTHAADGYGNNDRSADFKEVATVVGAFDNGAGGGVAKNGLLEQPEYDLYTADFGETVTSRRLIVDQTIP